jgi:hypothetical protein
MRWGSSGAKSRLEGSKEYSPPADLLSLGAKSIFIDGFSLGLLEIL